MKDRNSSSDSDSDDDDLKAAEEALANARKMPSGPERILALKQAGQMRYDAEERRRAKNEGVTNGVSDTNNRTRKPSDRE